MLSAEFENQQLYDFFKNTTFDFRDLKVQGHRPQGVVAFETR